MDDDLPEKCVKLVMLGDSSVGKTSLVTRFCYEEFGRQYYPTPGVDFFLKRTTIQGNRLVRAIMWDLGGQALEGSMFKNYLHGSQVILLVFDITNATSFTRLTDWWKAASRCIFGKPPLLALIANKCDMEHQRAVSLDKQMKFVNEHGIQSTHTVSARTGENVMLAFQRILAELLGVRLSKAEQEEQQGVVKAEIVAANHNQAYAGLPTTNSTICVIQ
ncbi:ras-related protein Rab-28-like [Macrosteles quadrilineatus]|uniref:ras-related protein Rab-28-like n=1 Tax=Macrosteles quadrilineatus TaxID=74068 RepID=UPI0023E2AD9F|nr:ras-related protein Rab-28-like [Macrosteles quadrilineatus]